MRRTGLTALIAIAITLILVACDRGGGVPLPDLTLTGTDSLTISTGTQVTVTGTGFFEPGDALRTTVQVCGVMVPAYLVEPVMHQVALPPAGMRNVQTSESITFEVAADGFVAGTDQTLTVTRPDGASATLEGIDCESPLTPEPQPDPDPEPQPDPYSLTVTVAGQGSIEADPDLDSYEADTEVTLTASPAPGWYFQGWGGDLNGTENPVTVTLEADTSVTAQFDEALASDFVIGDQSPTGEVLSVDVSLTNNSRDTITLTSVELMDDPGSSVYGDAGTSDIDAGETYNRTISLGDDVSMADVAGMQVSWTVQLDGESFTLTGGFTGVAAIFDADPQRVMVGEPVAFRAYRSLGQGELNFLWDFGDGSPTVDGNAAPSHTYAAVGDYQVRLTVSDETGRPVSSTLEIVVADVLTAGFSTRQVGGHDSLTVSFTPDGVTGGFPPYEYLWSFGEDAGSSDYAQPAFSYSSGGRFEVALTVTDSLGNEATAARTIGVGPTTAVISTESDSVGVAPYGMLLDASNSYSGAGEIVGYEWAVYSLDSDDDAEIHHDGPVLSIIMGEGLYRFELTVVDEFGVRDSTTLEVVVTGAALSVSIDPRPGMLHNDVFDVEFKAVVSGGREPYSYEWQLPEGVGGLSATDSASVWRRYPESYVKAVITVTDYTGTEVSAEGCYQILPFAPEGTEVVPSAAEHCE